MLNVRLTDLNPRWVSAGEGRHGMGVGFDCPCMAPTCWASGGTGRGLLVVKFANPLDGGLPFPPSSADDDTRWHVDSGTTFEDLTLSPSILFPKPKFGPQHWHGFIKQGEVSNA